VKHSFFNPKLGLTYQLSKAGSLYMLTGINHKEPNRDDYVESTPNSRPGPEQLWDTELGFRFAKKNWSLNLNGYYMSYKDQLVPTGRLNDVGAYTRVNVDDSYRLGLESSIHIQLLKQLDFTLQATASDNRIETFDEYVDNWATGDQEIISHNNTQLAFSPQFISSAYLDYSVVSKPKWALAVNLSARYVGEQYVDNTSNPESLLESYFVSDAGIKFSVFPKFVKEISLGFKVNNLTDAEYESNGWIYRFRSADYDPTPDDPYAGSEGGSLYHLRGYYPQAWRNFMLHLTIDF
jgi:iron complex outermembrane receptor protein